MSLSVCSIPLALPIRKDVDLRLFKSIDDCTNLSDVGHLPSSECDLGTVTPCCSASRLNPTIGTRLAGVDSSHIV